MSAPGIGIWKIAFSFCSCLHNHESHVKFEHSDSPTNVPIHPRTDDYAFIKARSWGGRVNLRTKTCKFPIYEDIKDESEEVEEES